MKKSILIGLLLVGTSCLLFAQPERMPFGEKSFYNISNSKLWNASKNNTTAKSYIFADDFDAENYNISDKWDILRSNNIHLYDSVVASNPKWFECTPSSFNGNGYNYIKSGAKSAAISYTAQDYTWLLMKDTITVPTNDHLKLTFWLWYSSKYPDYVTNFYVVAYDIDSHISDTLNTWGYDSLSSVNNQYNHREVLSLDNSAGKRIRIGFVYKNSNNANTGIQLAIDNVLVTNDTIVDIGIKANPIEYSSFPSFLFDSIQIALSAKLFNNYKEYTDTLKIRVDGEGFVGNQTDSIIITDTLNAYESRDLAFTSKFTAKTIGNHYITYAVDPENEIDYSDNADTIKFALNDSKFATDNGVIGGFSLGKDQEFGNIYTVTKDAFIGGVQIEWPAFNNTKEFTPFEFVVRIYELNPIDNSINRTLYTDSYTKTAESSDVYVNYPIEEPIFCTHGFSYLVTVTQTGNEALGIGYDGSDAGSFWKLNQTTRRVEQMANPTIGNVALRLTMTKPEENPLVTFTVKNSNSEAIRNVKIYIPELDSTLKTNSNGIATITLDNGYYSYQIDTLGFAMVKEEFKVFSQDKFFNIELAKPYWVKFKITDASDVAIAGAEIIIEDSTLISNSLGLDSILLAPNDYDYYIMATGYENYDWGFLEHVEKDTLVTVKLNTATTYNLTVKVVNEKNELLSNAEVAIMGYGWKFTNTEGQVTFKGINDTDIDVFAAKSNYMMNFANIALVKDSTIQIKLLAERYNVTFFVNSKGTPILNAEIIIEGIDTVKTGLTGYAIAQFIPFGNGIPYRVKYNGYHTYTGTFDIDDRDIRVDVSLTLTDVEPSTIQEINIYPNPNTGEFTISNEGKYSIMIFDIAGRLVYHNNLAFDKTPININDKSAGIYIVKVISENGITTKRIIKQ